MPTNCNVWPCALLVVANLCTWTLLVLDKALPMMHHENTHNAIDCWSSLHWLLIPPRINSQQCWSSIASLLTIGPLTVDCWSGPPRINSEQCWSLIASLLTIDPLTVGCWSPQDQQSTSVDHQSPHCWLSTLSLLTVDPSPQDQQSTVLIIDHLTVDCRPSPLQIPTL